MALADVVAALEDKIPDEGERERIATAARFRVSQALGAASTCPEEIENEAAIRLAAWIFDTQPGVRESTVADVTTRFAMSDALESSGARDLIEPWVRRRAKVIR